MKEIHLNDWVEFTDNGAEIAGLVLKILDGETIVIRPQHTHHVTMKIQTSAIVRINYLKV